MTALGSSRSIHNTDGGSLHVGQLRPIIHASIRAFYVGEEGIGLPLRLAAELSGGSSEGDQLEESRADLFLQSRGLPRA